MSEFVEYEPLTKITDKIPLDGVTLHSHKMGKVENLVFSFGDDVSKKLGWAKGDKVKVMWGTGSNKHKVQIKIASKIGWPIRKRVNSSYSRFFVSNFPPEINREKVEQIKVHHEMIEGVSTLPGYMILTLPKDILVA